MDSKINFKKNSYKGEIKSLILLFMLVDPVPHAKAYAILLQLNLQ
jgi:hypothetical protein